MTGVVLVSCIWPFSTEAAKAPTLAAKRMIASPPVAKLDQQEIYRYTIGFKNTGTTTWENDGARAVTVKTTEKVRVEHWFASTSWLDKTTVTNSATDGVKPGEVGFFPLTLQAPQRAGTYTNRFALFFGATKIPGTDFTMVITVTKKQAAVTKRTITPAPTAKTATTIQLTSSPYLTAFKMLQSDQALSLMAGETKLFQVGFKNTGERNWRDSAPSAIALTLEESTNGSANFNDGSWLNDSTPAALSTKLVKTGELGFFSFTAKAPSVGGTYNPQFRLIMNGSTLVTGSEFRLPISVTAPPPPVTPTLTIGTPGATNGGPQPGIVCAAAVDDATNAAPAAGDQTQVPNEPGLCTPAHTEPTVRVGLASVQGQLGVTANGPYTLADANGQTLQRLDSGVTIFLAYDPIGRTYTAIGPGPIITSRVPLRVQAVSEPSIITLTTFSNPTAFDAALNDNVYRGSMEINWSDNDQKLWSINELKMEEYLPGLAETSNGSPAEYKKALIVAARTYALYHYQTKLKHAVRHFDVIATVGDQYYRGHNAELRLPNVAEAVRQTRGQVVTYQNQVVVTPYSAATDGTTRAWEDAWGGTPKPWLIRKPVPEDVGRQRFGHGVGMSQLAAADQAKAGKNYVDILKFFYVGTEVSQWY